MRKLLLTLLIGLCLATNLNAESGSKTLWDLVENKCKIAGLETKSLFIDEDPWTMKINEDYEVLIDVMMATLEKAELPRDPYWYEKKEYILLLGFIAGFMTAK